MSQTKKYISLSKLGTYHAKNKAYIDSELQTLAGEMLDVVEELDNKIDSNATHNHDTKYDAKGSADTALETANAYTDEQISEVTDIVQGNIDTLSNQFSDHKDNVDIHFTVAERTKLNGIADKANNYSHPNSGVIAGNYKSITVDAQGHVTAGSNPTTLAGFGITDAEAKGTVNTHNTSTDAHNDIRVALSNLTTKVTNFLDINDTTADQLSEIIALINNNKTDIASITSNKVNVTDIVNNLTTNVSNKPLSAAQGVVLKSLIDGITKSSLGLGNVDNTADADKTVKAAGTATTANTLNGLTATVAELNILDGVTVTAAEINYVDGVTSNIQTQLNNKADVSTVPTKVSQLTNDSGFKTTDNNTTYTLTKSGSTITLTGSDGSTTSVSDSNTTYSNATTSAAGLMSAADKTKLDGLQGGGGGFDFDALINASGYSYTYVKSTGVETIKQGSTTYATRTSTKNSSGVWTVVTVCSAAGVNVTKTYTPSSTGWTVA